MASTIRIAILANAAQAKAELKSTASFAEKIGGSFAKFRAPAAAALGAIGLGAIKAVQGASDLNETVSKSNQIFGSSAGAINDWASGAASNLGLSKQAALDNASQFGNMFTQLGFTSTAAADLSKNVVQTAADLGSFNNVPTADVADKIQASLRGEYDGLQTLIPGINAARVEHEALIQTGKKSASQLTDQEKATATLAIIQKDGSSAAGDFARTQGGAANQAKIAAANAQNLSTQLGSALLPAYTAVLGIGVQFTAFLSQHATAVTVVIGVIAGLAAAILAVSAATAIANTVMTVIRVATLAWAAAQAVLNVVMSLNPIGLVVLAIAALVAIFIVAYQRSETFRAIVNGALNGVKTVAIAVFNGIKAVALVVWAVISAYVRTQIAIISAVIRVVRTVAVAVWNAIKSAATSAFRAVASVVRSAIATVRSTIQAVRGVAVAVWNAVKSAATSAFNGVKSAVTSAISAAKNKFNELRSTASSVLSRIRSLFSPSALVSAGAGLISGLVSGIRSRIGAAVDAVRAGVQRIKNLLPGSPIKDGPLRSWNNGGAGKRLMGLLASGIQSGAPGVRTSLSNALDPSYSLAGVSLGGGAGAGGAPVQITIQAGVGDPVEIGKQVGKYLNAYAGAYGKASVI